VNTSPASLYQRHHQLARNVANDYMIPGADRDDVVQEARIALWEACNAYDPEKGRFPSFARTVIRRRMIDAIKKANAIKHRQLTAAVRDIDDVAADESGSALGDIVAAWPTLSDLEREAVRAVVDGSYDSRNKAQETALYRARRKLKEATRQ
jgi:RNA polymerase sigma factor (sigma-70 family)